MRLFWLRQLQTFSIGDINVDTDWTNTLSGVHCVVHCAARAHQVINETETDALAAYRAVNVAGTRQLAEQAAKIGLRRLVYLSSIKVNGGADCFWRLLHFTRKHINRRPLRHFKIGGRTSSI